MPDLSACLQDVLRWECEEGVRRRSAIAHPEHRVRERGSTRANLLNSLLAPTETNKSTHAHNKFRGQSHIESAAHWPTATNEGRSRQNLAQIRSRSARSCSTSARIWSMPTNAEERRSRKLRCVHLRERTWEGRLARLPDDVDVSGRAASVISAIVEEASAVVHRGAEERSYNHTHSDLTGTDQRLLARR